MSKKGAQKRHWLVLVGCVALVVAVFLLLGGGAAWYFFVSGLPGGDREELLNRLLGEWHADVKDMPGVSIRIHIASDGLTLLGANAGTGGQISGDYKYEVLSHARERIVLRTTSREGRAVDWTFDFKGDNDMVWTVVSDKTRKHAFHRLGGPVPSREEREKFAQRSRETLAGKWNVIRTGTTLFTELTLDFGPNDAIVGVFTRDGKKESVQGRYRVVWADDKTVRLKIEGCEKHMERLEIEFRDVGSLGILLLAPGVRTGMDAMRFR